MITFICLFFPAVVSLWLYEALAKTSLGLKKCIFRFCLNSLIINFVCFVAKKFVFDTASYSLYIEGDMLPSTALNYLIIALPIAVILVLAEVLLSKKIKITVEENRDEAKEKE